MLKSQRQIEIIEILKKEKFVTVRDLASRLFSSPPTLRRDLCALEQEGYVSRCHGGAMIIDENTKPPLRYRKEKNIHEKINICRVAAELIIPRTAVFLDSSTTALGITEFISPTSDLTVVTNSLPVIERLAECGVRVYSLGGAVDRESLAFVGRAAEESINSYNVDTMFFSVSSLSDDGILSDWSEGEAGVRARMATHASTVVLMCDSTKFGHTSAFRLFPISEVDFIVTDRPLSNHIVEKYSLSPCRTSPAYLYRTPKKKK
jgi:DeoR/GlpR family transcriptional regulator of sugar metabolism